MSQLNIRKLSGKGNQPVEALTGITSETAPTGVKHLTRKDYVDNSIINAINAIGLGTASTHDVGVGAGEIRTNSENDAKFVDKTRTVSTSGALSGGGDLSVNRTLTVRDASTTQTGVVQLESGLTSTSTTTAATASTVKALKDSVDTAQSSANTAQSAADAAQSTADNANASSYTSYYDTGVVANTHVHQVNTSYAAAADAPYTQVNSSLNTINTTDYSSVWGANPLGSPSTANQQIRLESDGGVGRFKGNITTSGFDYAEYFPNLNKGTISNGTIVTLSEDRVKPAQEGDFILGVVSGTSGIIGNSAEFCWHKRHLVDEFGVTITEDVEVVSFNDYYGLVSECSKPIPSDAKRWIEATPVENPDYVDISSEYQSRGERKEDWSIIGLMGQVFVRTSEQLEEGDHVTASGSKSVQETRLRVMKMTTDFDPNKGYGVAFCLIR